MNKQSGSALLPIVIAVVIFIAAGYFLLNNKVDLTNSSSPNKDSFSKAISLLETIPEIKMIENSVIKAGRKPFFTPEGENGNLVTVSLRESFPNDPHTSRIDTFIINVSSKKITVSDVVTNKDISLEEWKKTVKERFQ